MFQRKVSIKRRVILVSAIILLILPPLIVLASKSKQKQTDSGTIENIYKEITYKAPDAPKFVWEANYTPKVIKVQQTASMQTRDLQQWLYDLRMCESSGDYRANTGNSYYGAYQFTLETWSHWNQDYPRADLAPAEVQDAMIILNTQKTMGLVTQNPGCYAKMGLSNKPPVQ